MKVAIIGSGVSGLAAAHRLRGQADITLFEAGSWFGGHAHTVDVTLADAGRLITHGVDTGFLVFNERTYPGLIQLFADLGVPTHRSDMSFSVQVQGAAGRAPLEWSGSSLSTVFAQRRNLLRPGFLGMLADLLRFNALATRLAKAGDDARLQQPLREFLDQNRFGRAFREWYFLPMIGCIWSCPTDQMLEFPVGTMIRFCHNHGLLQVADRPQWWTVDGGSRQYVERILSHVTDKRLETPVQRVVRDAQGVTVFAGQGPERFDQVVIATHSDQALALLDQPTEAEQRLLGAIRYQANRAVLHTDTQVMPQRRSAWAAWNYEGTAGSALSSDARVCLHYWLNVLQPLPWSQPVIVSLNPVREIDPRRVVGEWDYAHPVFDQAAVDAQRNMAQIQGRLNTWFCGAWMGYGFHEDGLKSGFAAADGLLAASTAPVQGAAAATPTPPGVIA